MPLKCQVYYLIFSYVVLRLYIRGSRWGIFRNTVFVCIFVHYLSNLLNNSLIFFTILIISFARSRWTLLALWRSHTSVILEGMLPHSQELTTWPILRLLNVAALANNVLFGCRLIMSTDLNLGFSKFLLQFWFSSHSVTCITAVRATWPPSLIMSDSNPDNFIWFLGFTYRSS